MTPRTAPHHVPAASHLGIGVSTAARASHWRGRKAAIDRRLDGPARSLLVHEAPIVRADDMAACIVEVDAHGHRNRLFGEEEDDPVVHRVFERA